MTRRASGGRAGPGGRRGLALCAWTLLACSSGAGGGGDDGAGGSRSSGGSETSGVAQVPGYDGPSLPPTAGPLPADELGPAFEAIVCHALIECEGTTYADVAACVDDREAEGLGDVLDGVADGSLAYDAAAMGECRRLFEVNLCALAGSFLFVPSVVDIVQLCLATRGARGGGEACRSGLECRAGTFCDRDTSCPGVCRTQRAVGEPCVQDEQCAPLEPLPELTLSELVRGGEALVASLAPLDAQCVEGVCRGPSKPGDPCPAGGVPSVGVGSIGCTGELTFCDAQSATCRARLGEGQPCTGDEQCEQALWCDAIDASGMTGACRARSAQGGPCDTASQCAPGLRCLARDADGRGSCATPSGRDGPCQSARDCAADLGCVSDACTELPATGAPCASGDRCATGLACSAESTCGELVPAGQACDERARLCEGFCREATCEPRLALGAACGVDAECRSRACAGGRCIDDELCASAAPPGEP